MGHAEDEVSLEISTKILSVPVLESFRVLVANCAVSGNYMLLVMSLFFPVVNIETVYICIVTYLMSHEPPTFQYTSYTAYYSWIINLNYLNMIFTKQNCKIRSRCIRTTGFVFHSM